MAKGIRTKPSESSLQRYNDHRCAGVSGEPVFSNTDGWSQHWARRAANLLLNLVHGGNTPSGGRRPITIANDEALSRLLPLIVRLLAAVFDETALLYTLAAAQLAISAHAGRCAEFGRLCDGGAPVVNLCRHIRPVVRGAALGAVGVICASSSYAHTSTVRSPIPKRSLNLQIVCGAVERVLSCFDRSVPGHAHALAAPCGAAPQPAGVALGREW
eukprot:SAG11_NODE_7060_length_1201_cov_0.862069_1_plen_215_part_00